MFQNPIPSHPFKLLPAPRSAPSSPTRTGWKAKIGIYPQTHVHAHAPFSSPRRNLPNTDTGSPGHPLTLEPSSLLPPSIFILANIAAQREQISKVKQLALRTRHPAQCASGGVTLEQLQSGPWP